MKKLILILSIILLPTSAWSKCLKAPDMGEDFFRCENKEAVCYASGTELSPTISCFKK